jgi:hypothetical protein
MAGLRAWASPRVANRLVSEQKTFEVVFLASRLLVVCVFVRGRQKVFGDGRRRVLQFSANFIPVSSFNISLKFRTRFASAP